MTNFIKDCYKDLINKAYGENKLLEFCLNFNDLEAKREFKKFISKQKIKKWEA